MATNQQNREIQSAAEFSKTKERLQAISHEIKALRPELAKIDTRLQSWSLALMEAIGLAVDDVKDDSHLYILPNEKLSRTDLSRKRNLISDKIEQLNAEMRSQYAKIRQLKFDARQEKNRVKEEQAKLQNDQIVSQYLKNPSAYLAANIIDITSNTTIPKGEIFARADNLIAVCNYFQPSNDLEQLWRGWKVVVKARNIAMDDYNNFVLDRHVNDDLHREIFRFNELYLAGAKRYIIAFTNLLLPGMQGLRLLYDARDYDRVDYYLKEAFLQHLLDDDNDYMQLLVDLAGEVHEACMRNARTALMRDPGFESLTEEMRNEAIEEQAYYTQLRFDISYLVGNLSEDDLKPFNTSVQELQDHIVKVLDNTVSKTIAEAAFAKIKLQIFQHADVIRGMLVSGEQVKLPEQICFGSGLGLGWLFGVQQVVSSAHTVKLINTQNMNLAQVLEDADYTFIRDQDKFWAEGLLPQIGSRSLTGVLRKAAHAFSKLFMPKLKKPIVPLKPSENDFTVPEQTMLEMESMAPGFAWRLASHFKGRAEDILIAIEQANKIGNTEAAAIIAHDLDELEQDWQKILNGVDDPEEFCAVVDLYLSSRYAAERGEYIDVAKDLRKEPYIEQERKVLLFEHQHEREEIQELHDLKQLLQQVIRPYA